MTRTHVAVGFADLPGWAEDDHAAALAAFRVSVPSLLASGGEGIAQIAQAAQEVPDRPDRQQARAFFETYFRPWRCIDDPGLLTGYYEPVVDGSLQANASARVPLYRRPPDLENVVAESARAAHGVALTHMRRTESGLEPYATRAQIEGGALAGQGLELCFVADPVDAFFLQVQGSGVIALDAGQQEGRSLRITYDGKNGHPYTSIGRVLIEEGEMDASSMSLQTLAAWLRAHPQRARSMMQRNESYVFFRALDEPYPIGVLGTQLFEGRSLAVDPGYHRLGLPIYVTAPTATHLQRGGFKRLLIAQDVGSAIRGPQRGDVFLGSGPEAGDLAGVTKHPVSFIVLEPSGAS